MQDLNATNPTPAFNPNADDHYRLAGTVAHAWLAHLVPQAIALSSEQIIALAPRIKRQLSQLRCSKIEDATHIVLQVLHNTFISDTPYDFLTNDYKRTSEYAITTFEAGRVNQQRFDLLCENESELLIVDYKVVQGTAADILRLTELYAPQLERYHDVAALHCREKPIKTALFFPLQKMYIPVH